MKKIYAISLIVFITSQCLKSQSCDTIFSFNTINNWHLGLTFDGNFLYTTSGNTTFIYKYSLSGQLYGTFTNPAQSINKGGDLDFDGKFLWMVSFDDHIVYKMDTLNGNVINQFNLYSLYSSGCAYDSGFIWTTQFTNHTITLIRIDTISGALIDSFPTNFQVLYLKINNGYLYGIGTNSNSTQLYKFEKASGIVVDSISWCAPGGAGFVFINNHIWALGTNQIFEFGRSPICQMETNIRRITSTLAICQGETVTIGSHIYSSTGTFIDTLSAYTGCDSIITTYLTVDSTYNIINTDTIGHGQSVMVGSHVYDSTGTYTDTLKAINNCDSIITTNLTVLTGIGEVGSSSKQWAVRIIPNPLTSSSTIEINKQGAINYEMSIYNLLGVKVREIKITNQKTIISREDLKGGIYFYKIINEKKEMIANGKVVIE